MNKKTWGILGVLVCVLVLVVYYKNASTHTTQPAADNTIQPTAIAYDSYHWQKSALMPNPFLDTKALLTTLGAAATQDETLDFVGNPAHSYHYHHKNEPALYVVDSDEFFEMVWYNPNPQDSTKDQALGQKYAERVYVLLTKITDAPDTFMHKLLTQQDLPKPLPHGVVFAQCQATLCQVVIQKAAVDVQKQ